MDAKLHLISLVSTNDYVLKLQKISDMAKPRLGKVEALFCVLNII